MTPARRLGQLARRNWLLTALLAAGLVLRILTQAAYRPALIYIDSLKYLYRSGGADPVGYRLLLDPLIAVGNLDLVAAVQHLLGLAMAITLYAVLLRRGASRWLSALATAPVLLDAYQLQIEQTIMPDAAFETLVVAGLAVLAWRARPTTALVIAGGLALGASATVRQVGEILIVPGLLYLLVAVPGWRQRLRQAAVCCAAFAVPILGYCSVAYLTNGHFRLSYAGTNGFYGRLVVAGDCQRLALPSYERPLCPSRQQALRLGIDGLEHSPASPLRRYQRLHQPPPGTTFAGVVSNFTQRLFLQDPAAPALAAGQDALKLFAVVRVTSPGDTPISRWQFQDHYPFYPDSPYPSAITPQVVAAAGRRFGGGGPAVARPLASFLRAYQLGGGYTPGPLLVFTVLAGLAGSLSLLRRRATPAQRNAARACLLTFTSAATVLLVSDMFEFSWRYQLPALVTLPPAAALGITALTGRLAHTSTWEGHEAAADLAESGYRPHGHRPRRQEHGQRQPAGGVMQDESPGGNRPSRPTASRGGGTRRPGRRPRPPRSRARRR